MNDLERNRIRRLENQLGIVTTQLALTNADLLELVNEVYNLYDPDHPRAIELHKKGKSIRSRVEAMRSLTPRQTV